MGGGGGDEILIYKHRTKVREKGREREQIALRNIATTEAFQIV